MSSIENITRYDISEVDNFLFDTNIRIYLYWEQIDSNVDIVNIYSNFFKTLLDQKKKIYITATVLSEFLNRSLRIDYDLLKKERWENYNYKRDYRGSSDYKKIVNHIKYALSSLYESVLFSKNDNFWNINMVELLDGASNWDLNDLIISEVGSENNYWLVTHDADFKSEKINILTANTKLLFG